MFWIKAAAAGLVGGVAGSAVYQLAIYSGLAPFNIYPFVAYLETLNIPTGGMNFFLQLIYGTVWSIFLVWIFHTTVNWKKGIGLAIFLWLIMGFVYAPVIGWGLFGFAGSSQLSPEHGLYLDPGLWFFIITLVHYLVYGYLIGIINDWWIKDTDDVAAQIRKHSEI